MLDYLLKSGGCLLVLYLFYVLFLEKENMHVYKRVYLLSIIVVSFIIPLVTFTNYVAIVEQIQPTIASSTVTEFPIIVATEQQSYLPMVLLSIYGLGVLLFGLKFIKNSFEIINKIKSNPKEKSGETTSVLLNEDIVPHTFLNFIFFNKKKYISHQIPKEVILHEETHARQKHSIDVLLLEFLQVIFWFNPIIYLLNKSVKLNHEFLADQAVLNNGANTKTYQKTLLAYSSNSSQLQLANAINYSSIKKRFTVMKTETSKKKIWIRSFVLLPVVALLLFSFSTTVQQEKATPQQVMEYNTLAKKYNELPKKGMVVKLKEVNRLEYLYKLMTPSQKKKIEKFPSFPPMPPSPKVIKGVNNNDLNTAFPPPLPKEANYILDNKKVTYEEVSRVNNSKIQTVDVIKKDEKGNKLEKPLIYIYTKKETKVVDESKRPITFINGKTPCNGCTLELTKEQLSKMVVTVEKGSVTEFKIKFPKKPTVTVSNSNTLNNEAKTFLQEAKIGQMAQIFNLKSSLSNHASHPVIFKIIE